ncbi:MAG: alpha/beta hydrolase-fold protein [Candidatus Competibacter sp.]|nr:alpha/beta hydrolase-fold protein [Candidatus Competibacter sp.]MDG4585512.1 alpha/beta hydrolase-fold protein [Candidatus Competibacter sp.]
MLTLSDGTGVIDRHADFPSRHIVPRHVDVWCPPEDGTGSETRYPVVYMQDGQNLFDPALSFIGVDWGMDEAVMRLIREGRHSGAIIVGIWNSPLRLREYMPQQPPISSLGQGILSRFIEQTGGEPLSDRYLKFLIEELKPFIDAAYPTLPDRAHTWVMGSSMGGLISLYALTEYPEVFGGAGCLSTHWPIGEEVLVDGLGAALPRAGRHRLYFDFGTETLDADYEPWQRRMDGFARAAGYREGRDWLTRKFVGAEHSERAWRQRVDVPLGFLLGGTDSESAGEA